MFDYIFEFIVSNSVTISIVICVILIARLLLQHAPAKYRYFLWGIVIIRLFVPIGISSDVSVFNYIEMQQMGQIQEAVEHNVSSRENKKQIDSLESKKSKAGKDERQNKSAVSDAFHTSQTLISNKETAGAFLNRVPYIKYIWLAGILVLCCYNIFLTISMRIRLRTAVKLRDRIWESDRVPTPFVWGIIRPRIYIPFRLTKVEQDYILLHEQYHIRRKDYLVKIIVSIFTCLYWFHPLIWIAAFLMVRDMEMSCDEYVLKNTPQDIREQYSKSLLGFATNHREQTMGLLAFGESNTRRRVKNVMKYKRQGKWIGIIAVVLIIIVGLVCLTDTGNKNAGTNESKTTEKETSIDSKINEEESGENKQEKTTGILISTQDIMNAGDSEQRLWKAILEVFPDPVVTELKNNGGVLNLSDSSDESTILFKNIDPKKSDPTTDPTLRLDFTLQNGTLIQYVCKEYGFVEDMPEERITEQEAKKLVQNFGIFVLQEEHFQEGEIEKTEPLAGYEGGDYIAFTDSQGGFYQVNLTKNIVDHYFSKQSLDSE